MTQHSSSPTSDHSWRERLKLDQSEALWSAMPGDDSMTRNAYGQILLPSAMMGDVEKLYKEGMPRGLSTGWFVMDGLWTYAPGQLTVVSGLPNMGKSEMLDALMVNLATLHGIKFSIFSAENTPYQYHYAKIAEKVIGKPFRDFDGTELGESYKFISDHFSWLSPFDTDLPTLMGLVSVLNRDREVTACVIDPWNQLETQRPKDISETDFIGQSLRDIRRFVREKNMHMFMVVHPSKMAPDRMTGKLPVPNYHQLHGSAHWSNMADNICVVHRDDIQGAPNLCSIHWQKVRFKWIGRRGGCTLTWNPDNGRLV